MQLEAATHLGSSPSNSAAGSAKSRSSWAWNSTESQVDTKMMIFYGSAKGKGGVLAARAAGAQGEGGVFVRLFTWRCKRIFQYRKAISVEPRFLASTAAARRRTISCVFVRSKRCSEASLQ